MPLARLGGSCLMALRGGGGGGGGRQVRQRERRVGFEVFRFSTQLAGILVRDESVARPHPRPILSLSPHTALLSSPLVAQPCRATSDVARRSATLFTSPLLRPCSAPRLASPRRQVLQAPERLPGAGDAVYHDSKLYNFPASDLAALGLQQVSRRSAPSPTSHQSTPIFSGAP
jgi:hypothetical protein